jgi:hypothetical protein
MTDANIASLDQSDIVAEVIIQQWGLYQHGQLFSVGGQTPEEDFIKVNWDSIFAATLWHPSIGLAMVDWLAQKRSITVAARDLLRNIILSTNYSTSDILRNWVVFSLRNGTMQSIRERLLKNLIRWRCCHAMRSATMVKVYQAVLTAEEIMAHCTAHF